MTKTEKLEAVFRSSCYSWHYVQLDKEYKPVIKDWLNIDNKFTAPQKMRKHCDTDGEGHVGLIPGRAGLFAVEMPRDEAMGRFGITDMITKNPQTDVDVCWYKHYKARVSESKVLDDGITIYGCDNFVPFDVVELMLFYDRFRKGNIPQFIQYEQIWGSNESLEVKSDVVDFDELSHPDCIGEVLKQFNIGVRYDTRFNRKEYKLETDKKWNVVDRLFVDELRLRFIRMNKHIKNNKLKSTNIKAENKQLFEDDLNLIITEAKNRIDSVEMRCMDLKKQHYKPDRDIDRETIKNLYLLDDCEHNKLVAEWFNVYMPAAFVYQTFFPGTGLCYQMGIISGPQGAGKTRQCIAVCEAIHPDGYSPNGVFELDDRKIGEQSFGTLLCEDPEGVGLRKNGIERVKAIISKGWFKPRFVFDKQITLMGRTWIWVLTTNDYHAIPLTGMRERRLVPFHIEGYTDGWLNWYPQWVQKTVGQMTGELLDNKARFEEKYLLFDDRMVEAHDFVSEVSTKRSELMEPWLDRFIEFQDDNTERVKNSEYMGKDYVDERFKDRTVPNSVEIQKFWAWMSPDKRNNYNEEELLNVLRSRGYKTKSVRCPARGKSVRMWVYVRPMVLL